MSSETYDLAIIGGGPAGCSAAITAARLGLRTILFEARTYPHDKLCGEFLSPECAGMLAELGAGERIATEHPQLITQAYLSAPDGFAWETALPGTAWGLTRKALDAILAERAVAAGTILQPATTIDNLRGSLQSGYSLEGRSGPGRCSVNARTVIAAYGKRSSLDRALQRRFLQREQPFVAFKAHFTGINLPGRVELHAFPGGYCGLSMVENPFNEEPTSNICFLAHAHAFQRARQTGQKPLEAFLVWMRQHNPHLDQHFSQARPTGSEWLSIAQVPFTSKTPVEGGVLMAGDAAGLIVPLAGDGISMALRSGMLAANKVFQYLNKNLSADWLTNHYARTWKQAFQRRLRLGRVLQSLILRPALVSASLRLVYAYPALGHYFLLNTREINPHGYS